MQADRAAARVMVVDTDVHQGNGTAYIFADDSSVFTLSIHQEKNYPVPKPPSDLDINIEDGAGDEEYLRALGRGLDESFARFSPDLLFYLAGADPYREDQLGGSAADACRIASARRSRVCRGPAARRACRGHAGGRLCAKYRRYRAHSHEYRARGARLFRQATGRSRAAGEAMPLSAENR